jgi:hypothetical protein
MAVEKKTHTIMSSYPAKPILVWITRTSIPHPIILKLVELTLGLNSTWTELVEGKRPLTVVKGNRHSLG